MSVPSTYALVALHPNGERVVICTGLTISEAFRIYSTLEQKPTATKFLILKEPISSEPEE